VPFLPESSEASRAQAVAVADDAELTQARRALITRRLPYFALGWLALGLVLRTGLVSRGGLSLRLAVASIALQMAVLVAAIGWCRRAPTAPRVPWIAFGACVGLVVLATGFFSRMGGSIEVFVFALLVICIGSSTAFAWGWVPATALLALAIGIGGSAALGASALHRFIDPVELLLETLIGGAISVVIAEGSARGVARAVREARAAREAAERLAAAYDAYRDLADNAPDLIFTHDLDGRITYANEAFARACGVAAPALIGWNVASLVPSDTDNPDPDVLRARMVAGEDVSPQLYWVKAKGGRRWFEVVASPIRDADGRVAGARGIVRDVTARRAAEEALRASLEDLRRSEERLRRLARHHATIREEERKRLGCDLHDDVCQELVGVGILIESLRHRVVEAAPALAPELARIGRYVGEVGEHLRQLARDLRPMLLRELGLQESVHSLAEAMTAAGTPATAVFPTPIPRLDEETEIGVYRIAQEALANAVRHAQAATVQISLGVTDGVLALEVRDDGCGFVPDAPRGDALGLVGMEERALALGGLLDLRSAPGRGTRVRLTCPIAARAAMSAA
jgi:two-component system sensor histidine kinase UhpB